MFIDVSSMPLPAIGIFLDSLCRILEAISAIAFITASRTPGSYSVCPAPSTKRISASRHSAASACEVAGGHSRS
jgi:hypothetical protein